MNLDDYKIYVFIREDLPLGQDDIQSNHACYHAGMEFAAQFGLHPGIPFMVTIGCPSIKSLRKAQRKMDTAGIGYYVMTDTDVAEDPTAIASFPLDQVQKEVLREYRLRNYSPRMGALPAPVAGFNAERGANADVAQAVEHSVLNGEVAGAAPAVSSNS